MCWIASSLRSSQRRAKSKGGWYKPAAALPRARLGADRQSRSKTFAKTRQSQQYAPSGAGEAAAWSCSQLKNLLKSRNPLPAKSSHDQRAASARPMRKRHHAVAARHAKCGFQGLLRCPPPMKREAAEDVDRAVQAIIADVVAKGDTALFAYSQKFDRIDLKKKDLRVGPEEIGAACESCSAKSLEAPRFSHARIVAFHERQLP